MKKITLTLLIIATTNLNAQNYNFNKIDSLFSELNTTKEPGAAVAVFKNGEIVYSKGFGMANLKEKISINRKSKFRIGSTSKQFTAACILILIEQGKIKYTDKLNQFFHSFPNYASTITIRHLLHHTSGIRDYPTIALLKGLYNNEIYTDDMIMDWLTRQKQLNFKPGEEFMYSNSNYWLLGQIVENVSGKNLADFANEHLFKPLQMDNSHFHNNNKYDFKNRVIGYSTNNSQNFTKNNIQLEIIGDGGLYTTILDLAKWDNVFYKKNNVNNLVLEELIRKGKLNDGSEINYGGGLFISNYKGLKAISHSGVVEGFKSQLLRFIDEKLSIVVLANRDDINAVEKAKQIADILLADKLIQPKQELVKSKLDKVEIPLENILLKQAVGYYEIQPAVGFKIMIENDSLKVLQTWNNIKYPIVRLNKNQFQHPNDSAVTYIFTNIKNNVPTNIVLAQSGAQPVFIRKDLPILSNAQINNYVGKFYSDELDEIFEIYKNENNLKVKIRNNKPISLHLVGNNKFSYLISTITFFTNEDEITHFQLNSGRVKNIKFIKV
ncbi:MAG TPA: serine hydrolase domain-containing protein [Flavobacteriaceae bacterium]|nr:serine hydrolase domain-containing protein [Flavobacteriaceae bacterium]